MIYIPAKDFAFGVIIDAMSIVFYLLMRKQKKKESTDLKLTRKHGLLLVFLGIITLIAGHFGNYNNYIDYFLGFSLDSLLFLAGMKLLVEGKNDAR